MKLGDFGTFVVFTAIYAAGTLGLPRIPLLAYQVRIGEMPTAFVAMFGLPAVFGLTLGQFIADLGVQTSPIAMVSPIVSLIGLYVVHVLRKSSALAGCISYIIITSAWLTFLLPMLSGISTTEAAYSAFVDQTIAVMIGYAVYVIVRKTMFTQPASTGS